MSARPILSFFIITIFMVTIFTVAAWSVFAEEELSAVGQTVSVSAVTESESVVMTFFRRGDGTETPFAEMRIPGASEVSKRETETKVSLTTRTPDVRLIFSVDSDTVSGADGAFVTVTAIPLYRDDRPSVDVLRLPSFRLTAESLGADKTESLRVLGTGGVKPASDPSGSYSFLGVVNPENNRGFFAGWLTNRHGNGVFFPNAPTEESENGTILATPQIDYGRYPLPKSDVESDDADVKRGETLAIGYFDDLRDGLESYGQALCVWNHVRLKPAPTGYCSWYSDHHGRAGDEKSTAEFAKMAREKLVPYGMTFFQIDDGWQCGDSRNGPNKNFTAHRSDGPYPSGMKGVSETLAESGLTTGIWFMPFSGNANDPWFGGERQGFFVRSAVDYPSPGEKNTRRFSNIDQKKGAPYETYWGGTCLDMTHPGARQYLFDMVRRIAHDWNCRYFKIDGLWTGAGIEQLYINDSYLPDDLGQQIFHDPDATNIEAYRTGLSVVREAAGDDVFILGCNVSQNMRVLGASVGYVDAMRIGPDNGADWKGICAGPWRGTNRYFYNARVWWNDPDPVYVRDSIPLHHAQVITSWTALTGQLYAFSDWLPGLSEERVNVIRRTIPNHGLKTVRPVDLFTSDLARVWVLTDRADDPDRFAVTQVGDVGEPAQTVANHVTPDRFIVGFFNWNEKEATDFEYTPEKLGLPTQTADGKPVTRYVAWDFWGQRPLSSFGESVGKSSMTVNVPAASCLIASVRPVTDQTAILLNTSRHITQGILEVTEEKGDRNGKSLDVTVDAVKGALTGELPYSLRIYRPCPTETSSVTVTADGTAIPAVPTIERIPEENGDGIYEVFTFPPLDRKILREDGNADVTFHFRFE